MFRAVPVHVLRVVREEQEGLERWALAAREPSDRPADAAAALAARDHDLQEARDAKIQLAAGRDLFVGLGYAVLGRLSGERGVGRNISRSGDEILHQDMFRTG